MSKHKGGRPPADIDLEKFKLLCEVGCSNREIAQYFGVSERTIEQRKKRPEFAAAAEHAHAKTNYSLRHKQISLALKGDVTMLIWLGKNRLGQKDKVETSGELDLKPPTIHVNFVDAETENQETAE